MDRDLVKTLHKRIDEALDKVAKENGFIYKPGSLRYSDVDVSGKVRFILTEKKTEFDARHNITEYLGLKAGTQVRVGLRPEVYEVTGFTTRGSALLKRVRDGKLFRAKPHGLRTLDNKPATHMQPWDNTEGRGLAL